MSGDLAEIFSRKMRAASIGAAPVHRHVAARAEECAALAKAFGLPGIAELSGEFALSAEKTQNGIIDAGLVLRARVTQICVITLEKFDAALAETARLRFVPAATVTEDAEIAELNPESLDGPDEIPYAGEAIDLGATLSEQLALALDPYPRKPGAQLPSNSGDSTGNPFAALAARRGNPANDTQ